MSAFSYDATVSPNPVSVTASLSASGNSLVATLTSLSSFSITLKPSGNIAQWILSAIAYPLVSAVVSVATGAFNALATMVIKPISVTEIAPIPVALTSTDSITVTVGSLSLSGANGYVTLTGTVTVS